MTSREPTNLNNADVMVLIHILTTRNQYAKPMERLFAFNRCALVFFSMRLT